MHELQGHLPAVRVTAQAQINSQLGCAVEGIGIVAQQDVDRIGKQQPFHAWEIFFNRVPRSFHAPVERLDPFRKIAFDGPKLGVADLDPVVSTAAVAVGLALRRAGDR